MPFDRDFGRIIAFKENHDGVTVSFVNTDAVRLRFANILPLKTSYNFDEDIRLRHGGLVLAIPIDGGAFFQCSGWEIREQTHPDFAAYCETIGNEKRKEFGRRLGHMRSERIMRHQDVAKCIGGRTRDIDIYNAEQGSAPLGFYFLAAAVLNYEPASLLA